MQRITAVLLALCAVSAAHAARVPPRSPELMSLQDLPTRGTGCKPRVLSSFPYKDDRGLKALNPFLTDADFGNTVLMTESACKPNGSDSGRPSTSFCNVYPSLWSGAYPIPTANGEIRMLGITDRGPNGDCTSGAFNGAKQFPVPKFAPSVMEVTFNKLTGKAQVAATCPLRNPDGSYADGLPNIATYDDLGANNDCTAPTGTSLSGIDSEDIVLLSKGLCAASDEYSPSIWVFNCQTTSADCGKIVARYVPVGLVGLEAAPYPVKYVLPKAYLQRRKNRGLENLAVNTQGTRLWTLMQSSMGPTSGTGNTARSQAILASEISITNIQNPTLVGVYLYLQSRVDAPNTWISPNTRPRDVKLSAVAWAGNRVGVSGRKVLLVNEREERQVKYFLTDFTGATNLKSAVEAANFDPLFYDKLFANGYDAAVTAINAAGIIPAKKIMAFDTGDIAITYPTNQGVTGFTFADKQEALAILNNCVIGIGDDNDFGLTNLGPSTFVFVQLGSCLPELYAALRAQP